MIYGHPVHALAKTHEKIVPTWHRPGVANQTKYIGYKSATSIRNAHIQPVRIPTCFYRP